MEKVRDKEIKFVLAFGEAEVKIYFEFNILKEGIKYPQILS